MKAAKKWLGLSKNKNKNKEVDESVGANGIDSNGVSPDGKLKKQKSGSRLGGMIRRSTSRGASKDRPTGAGDEGAGNASPGELKKKKSGSRLGGMLRRSTSRSASKDRP